MFSKVAFIDFWLTYPKQRSIIPGRSLLLCGALKAKIHDFFFREWL